MKFNFKIQQFIFPVVYEPQRIYGNSIVTHIINGILKMVENKVSPDDMSDELRVYQQILFLSFATKHKSWVHEVEYRIMNPFEDYFPAIPQKIFIGMNCKKKYRKRLKEIGDSFGSGCEVYQMELSRNTEAFELIRK